MKTDYFVWRSIINENTETLSYKSNSCKHGNEANFGIITETLMWGLPVWWESVVVSKLSIV
jgi:hypothetical protein